MLKIIVVRENDPALVVETTEKGLRALLMAADVGLDGAVEAGGLDEEEANEADAIARALRW